MPARKIFLALLPAIFVLGSCTWSEQTLDEFTLVTQRPLSRGPQLGYSPGSGVTILSDKGLAFKDHNRNGRLDVYEDWRRSPEERTEDLVKDLSIEEIAGLMLCSHMQSLPGTDVNHYGGRPFEQGGAYALWDLTDEQTAFLRDDHLRSILMASAKDLHTIVKWVDGVQRYVEGMDHGIPCVILSDPRNSASSDMEFEAGAGGEISRWPGQLAMAATFDPSLVREFGRIAATEYRAMGITTALSPQADVPSEPRWWRFDGTFGEGLPLLTDMVRAYCDGFQTSGRGERIEGAWGYGSVNAMVKHWYGYGAQEGGREGHFAHGAYAVYPADNMENLKTGFTEGAFKLDEGTGSAAAVMSAYQVPWNQEPEQEGNVGVAFSDYIINQKLRSEAGFDGVVCTDWGVMFDCTAMDWRGRGKSYGVEDLTLEERFYRILRVGGDQFGDKNRAPEVLAAHRMWVRDFGEQAARERFELSARRILLNMFRVGAFENPYLDYGRSRAIVGSPSFMEKGYEAQVKSIVMLKNRGAALPQAEGRKVYLPKRHFPATPSVWGEVLSEDKMDWCIDSSLVARYYTVTDNPEDADFALVAIKNPSLQLGYSKADIEAGGNGYVPVSLQYEDYTATSAREISIAGGCPLEDFTNRSYRGKTVRTLNRDDMLLVRRVKEEMGGGKPVAVVVCGLDKPMVMSEIEPFADAILLNFRVQNQAVMDIVSGRFEPSGLLPMQLPADMQTVETQLEDVPLDMRCHRDTEGSVYDYAFGMNWAGVINDARVLKYGSPKR